MDVQPDGARMPGKVGNRPSTRMHVDPGAVDGRWKRQEVGGNGIQDKKRVRACIPQFTEVPCARVRQDGRSKSCPVEKCQ